MIRFPRHDEMIRFLVYLDLTSFTLSSLVLITLFSGFFILDLRAIPDSIEKLKSLLYLDISNNTLGE